MELVLILLAIVIVLACRPLGFASQPDGAGAPPAGAAAPSQATTAAEPAGGAAAPPETTSGQSAAGGDGHAAASGAGQPGRVASPRSAKVQEIIDLIENPADAEWAYNALLAASQAGAASKPAPGAEANPATGSGAAPGDSLNETIKDLRRELADIKGQREREAGQQRLVNWARGVRDHVSAHDLAKLLDSDEERLSLAQLAMAYGAARQLDKPEAAAKAFGEAIVPLVDKLSAKKAQGQFAQWKRDFVAGKVQAARETPSSGKAGTRVEQGEEPIEPGDLESGKLKERIKREMRAGIM